MLSIRPDLRSYAANTFSIKEQLPLCTTAIFPLMATDICRAPASFGGSDAPGNLVTIPAVMISQADGDVFNCRIESRC